MVTVNLTKHAVQRNDEMNTAANTQGFTDSKNRVDKDVCYPAKNQSSVTLCTAEIVACLSSGLSITAFNISLSFSQKVPSSGLCRLAISIPPPIKEEQSFYKDAHFHVNLIHQTCTPFNSVHLWSKYKGFGWYDELDTFLLIINARNTFVLP